MPFIPDDQLPGVRAYVRPQPTRGSRRPVLVGVDASDRSRLDTLDASHRWPLDAVDASDRSPLDAVDASDRPAPPPRPAPAPAPLEPQAAAPQARRPLSALIRDGNLFDPALLEQIIATHHRRLQELYALRERLRAEKGQDDA